MKDKQYVYAQPYQFLEIDNNQSLQLIKNLPNGEKKLLSKKLSDQKPWAPSQINDDVCSFQTKTFLIRYSDEEIVLNDLCFFKTEMEAYPSYDNEPFYVVCELMCADLASFGQASNKPKDEEESLFKCVAVCENRISQITNGIHEYMPITFDDQHFCLANTTFHSLLLDFKFKLSDYQIQLVENQQSKQAYNQNKENRLPNAQILIQPKDFIEFLNKATSKFKSQLVDKFNADYIISLREEYKNLTKFISMMLNQHINKDLISSYPQLKETIPDLPIPEYLMPQNLNDSLQQKLNSEPLKIQTSQHKTVTYPNISEYFKLYDIKEQDKLAQLLQKEINQISGALFIQWNRLIELFKAAPHQISYFLHIQNEQIIRDRWGESIFRDEKKSNDITKGSHPDVGKNNATIAKKMRNQYYYQNLDPLNIENINMFPQPEDHPFLFEEIQINQLKTKANKTNQLVKQGSQEYSYNELHLFVFCHGFQGNQFDLRSFKNNLALVYPQSLFLCSKINEDHTDGDIRDMGLRLSKEVKSYIQEWCPGSNLSKISFIGHSLGGVIIRSSLPHLSEYFDKFYTYMSLSSPHLGYMYNTSKHIDAGIWVLKQIRKSLCLQQLSMSETPEITDTFLYKLSKQPGINQFQNVAFVSSYQDQYVPFESARIEKCNEALQDPQNGKYYQQMVDGILGDLKADRVHRIDVNFHISDKTIDNMIGRAAHIKFLESDPLLKMFVYCHNHLFQ